MPCLRRRASANLSCKNSPGMLFSGVGTGGGYATLVLYNFCAHSTRHYVSADRSVSKDTARLWTSSLCVYLYIGSRERKYQVCLVCLASHRPTTVVHLSAGALARMELFDDGCVR